MKDFLNSERPKQYLKKAFPEYEALHPIFLIARKKLLSTKNQGRPKLVRKKSDITDHQVSKNISKVTEDIMAKTYDGKVRVWVKNKRNWHEYTTLYHEWDLSEYIRTIKPIDEAKGELFALSKGKKRKELGLIIYGYYTNMVKTTLGLTWKMYRGKKYLCQNLPAPRLPEPEVHPEIVPRYHVATPTESLKPFSPETKLLFEEYWANLKPYPTLF
jgi:hypothetical protein